MPDRRREMIAPVANARSMNLNHRQLRMGADAARPARVRAAIAVAALAVATACGWGSRSSTSLPPRLSSAAFWSLTTRLSEAPGTFEQSDNLVSNELRVAQMTRLLHASDGVYIGVGPEQNFTYMARLAPPMAFILDIRRENRNLHLLYKALFELSVDRADFVSRLFSRERPRPAGRRTSVDELFALIDSSKPARPLRDETARLVRERLLTGHGFPLSPGDLAWIDHALDAFYANGPDVHYGRFGTNDSPGPSYRTLMTAIDLAGEQQSYLASEGTFAFLKDLQARNLIVPVVGNFAGPTALRGIGDYVREHGGTVSAFYASNVEVYLTRQQRYAFCASLAALPYRADTWFIGSKAMQPLTAKLQSCGGPAKH